MRERVAVVGAGVSGLTAAYLLQRRHDVTLFEADARLGGHAHTHDVGPLAVDSGFIVHNDVTYPHLLRLFAELGVATQDSEMSMSVRDEATGLEYAGARGVRGLFAQPRNLANPRYVRMLAEVLRFHRAARAVVDGTSPPGEDVTFGEFLDAGGYSRFFVETFAVPVVSAVWSSGPELSRQYPARYLFTFLDHHGMLTVFGSQLGVALFSVGRSGPEGAASLGGAMAASAFGLLPMAVVMLQMRVFYAMNDARTPTLIMVVITAIKVPMAYLCPVLLPPEQVVLGLAGVNAFGFVVGLVVGNIWLRVRLGNLDTRRVLRTFVLTLLASIVAVLVAVLCVTLLERVLGGSTSLVLRSWLVLVSGSVVFLVVVAVAMRLLRVPELEPVVSRLRRLLGRGRASTS